MTETRLHQPDYTLIAVIFIIIIFGLIMLSSAGTVVAYQKFGDSNYYLKRQLLFGISLGLVSLFVASRIDYHFWQKTAFLLMALTIFALVIVLVPSLGYELGGARRWINFGGFVFQPSELAKLTFILYLATWLSKKGKEINNLTYGFASFLVLLGLITVLIMLQPDLGTMTVIAFVAVIVYFVAGGSIKHLIVIMLIGAAIFGLLVQIAPYRAARFTVFLNPEMDPQGIGYHVNQALLAIGSGGIFGLGLGHSRQKYNYLPEVTGDSIFAVIAEELGLIISIGLILLYLVLMLRGFRISRAAPDQFGKLVAVGITCWFTFQALVNIGSMVSILPLTGIPLPFISYGSSAIVISLLAIGILINISKQTKELELSSLPRAKK
ncbi:MAG: putative lipid II flippase FtsW [Candidatus Kerfeldbacteria bacterium CG08_land_8_20_14_0_20_40_16]|uniref:Probable peptidoglycan glycosyltransferase FtsW n=1 Tax=Candidatus Kerfeldbacteria bacterium CG08_land_8_20_14_0_20_40_16 TaxID=2014244 RepID=A0A2H0YW07_9BACT|nr:MAG: putative lipid II flippase FtsW [Candidatus Kerfeldbacteria bacterium CG08_land_8_20_14_0_20_40_16]